MKLILVLGFLFLSLHSEDTQAFNGRRCSKVFPGGHKGLGKVEKFWYTAFSVSTFTSQFFTSTGDCRMIGGVTKEERKFFVAHTAKPLLRDVVRAEGDYLAALTSLYGCDVKREESVFLQIQKNVRTIFGDNLNNDPVEVSNQIESLMGSDLHLKSVCSVQA